MKEPSSLSPVSLALFGALSILPGTARCDETAALSAAPPPAEAPRIVGKISDGTPPPAPPERVEPDYTVLKTTVRRQGGRNVTIQKVEPPTPAPKPPPPALPDLSDPEVQTQIAELQARAAAELIPTTLVPLDVTVYDHQFTFLRWTHRKENGESAGYAAWSNIDFNHLCGFAGIEVGADESRHCFALIMGLGNIDTARYQGREFLQMFADRPSLPADRPAFVLVEGDPDDAEAMALIQGLHDIYAHEKDRLVAAYEGRERARKEREAYLRAHPPEPEDITVRYWRKPKK